MWCTENSSTLMFCFSCNFVRWFQHLPSLRHLVVSARAYNLVSESIRTGGLGQSEGVVLLDSLQYVEKISSLALSVRVVGENRKPRIL